MATRSFAVVSRRRAAAPAVGSGRVCARPSRQRIDRPRGRGEVASEVVGERQMVGDVEARGREATARCRSRDGQVEAADRDVAVAAESQQAARRCGATADRPACRRRWRRGTARATSRARAAARKRSTLRGSRASAASALAMAPSVSGRANTGRPSKVVSSGLGCLGPSVRATAGSASGDRSRSATDRQRANRQRCRRVTASPHRSLGTARTGQYSESERTARLRRRRSGSPPRPAPSAAWRRRARSDRAGRARGLYSTMSAPAIGARMRCSRATTSRAREPPGSGWATPGAKAGSRPSRSSDT